MSIDTVVVSNARGESFADVARRVGYIGDELVAGSASDAEVLEILAEAAGANADTIAARDAAAASAALAISAVGDGYFTHPALGTRYRYGIVDGQVATVIAPHVVIDPVNGNDANDGLTVATAIKTTTAFWAHAALGAAGSGGSPRTVDPITIGIVGGGTTLRIEIEGRYSTAGNGYRVLDRPSFVDVSGGVAIMSCADVIPGSSFTPRGGVAGAYDVTVAHTMVNGTNRHQVSINGEALKRVQIGSIVAGTFAYTGTVAAGVPTAMVVFPFDGYDPRTETKTVEITTRSAVLSGLGGFAQGIVGTMNGSNDGSLILLGGPAQVRACEFEDGTKHNVILDRAPDGEKNAYDSYVCNSMDSGDYRPDEAFQPAMWTIYGATLDGTSVRMQDCSAVVDRTGQRNDRGNLIADPFLTHDAANPGAAYAEFDGWTAVGLPGSTSVATAARASFTRAFISSTGSSPAILAGTSELTVTRSVISVGGSGRWIDGTNVTARSNLFIAPDGPFSGGGITSVNADGVMDIRDNIFAAPLPQEAPAVDLSNGGTMTLRHNLFVGFDEPFNLAPYSASPTYTTTFNSDRNAITQRVRWGRFLNSSYKMAEIQAAFSSAYDQASYAVDKSGTGVILAADVTTLGFVGGTIPSITDPNVELTAGSPGALAVLDPITNAETQAMLTRPRTRAALRASLITAPARIPVIR